MEQVPIELSKNGVTGIMIGCLILVGMVFWYFVNFVKEANKSHEKSYKVLADAIEKQTLILDKNTDMLEKTKEVSNETITYLKMRNGSDTKRMLEEVNSYICKGNQ
jgi:hypothetical protein